ncbi:unnamed protein product [Albugo candida]|uniref:Uncharacterized protein n=1 Tax=Albugo candida TaxID=65357 RepID=A0A024FTZ2_9STRA|nr:unnamed protein product [Albugo candida]|eukprot:CCI10590.1 unnamed protein product [Albugo candida]
MCPYARNFSETSDFEIYYEHFSTRHIILQYMVAVEPHGLLDVASVAAAHSDCLSECSDQSNVTFNKQTCFHQRCAFRCTIFSCLFGAIGTNIRFFAEQMDVIRKLMYFRSTNLLHVRIISADLYSCIA